MALCRAAVAVPSKEFSDSRSGSNQAPVAAILRVTAMTQLPAGANLPHKEHFAPASSKVIVSGHEGDYAETKIEGSRLCHSQHACCWPRACWQTALACQ